MTSHPEFNHRALFPALEALPYVTDVTLVDDEVTDSPAIEISLTADGYGPVFEDIPRLAQRHKVVRTKPVSTIISLDRDTGKAVLQPV